MYYVIGNLLNGVKRMYINILTCVRVEGGESKGFRWILI